MKFIIFDQKTEPVLVEGKIFTNGIELKDIFYPIPNLEKLVFGDVVFIKLNTTNDDDSDAEISSISFTPVFREEIFASKMTQHEMISELSTFLEEKIDSLCNRIDSAVETLKKSVNDPKEIINLIDEFKLLTQKSDEISSGSIPTFSVNAALKEKAVKINAKIVTQKGKKIPIVAGLDTGSGACLISEKFYQKHPKIDRGKSSLFKINGITSNSQFIKSCHVLIKVRDAEFKLVTGIMPDLESKFGFDLLLPVDVFNDLVSKKYVSINIPELEVIQ